MYIFINIHLISLGVKQFSTVVRGGFVLYFNFFLREKKDEGTNERFLYCHLSKFECHVSDDAVRRSTSIVSALRRPTGHCCSGYQAESHASREQMQSD
jgi:hypothetical protein